MSDSAVGARRWWRWLRRLTAAAVLVVIGLSGQAAQSGLVSLSLASLGRPGQAARGTGHDALWLGHAWVDGRRGQSDVDSLVRRLRGTGVRDLFVHAGPFDHDGSLDPALRPRARWFVEAMRAALPTVRVQAWLGAHPVSGQLNLASATTRARLLNAVGAVLDDGFDGVHYDFEPIEDGDRDLLAVLRATRELTRGRGALLSVSAIHTEPWPYLGAALRPLPAWFTLWSGAYLHEVASTVDQVALMAYDTGLPVAAAYSGYVRRVTAAALAAVPPAVTLLIGVPTYQEPSWHHHPEAESIGPALRGIRLALGEGPPRPAFGVAVYVDFTVTDADWAVYRHDWQAGSAVRE